MSRRDDKLSEAKIAKIIRLKQEEHLSDQKIADQVGCSKATAQKYLAAAKAQAAPNGEGPHPPPASNGHGPSTGRWMPDQPPLDPHPLAELFPPLSGEALQTLADDITAHGVREAIWTYEGKILDGRNRFRVCQALVIACPIRAYTGHDPLGFVVSMNLHRRHLTESQRAMVAEKLANMRQGARTDVPPPANLPEVSTAKAAETLNISERLVRHARKVRAEAQPEVIKAVETGRMAVSAAAKLAEQPARVQREVVKKLATGEVKTFTAALREVQGTAPPPTRAEGRWLDPLAVVQANLREALNGFTSFGGLATVMGQWTPEQRQAFGERVAYVDGLWQQFLEEFRAIEPMSPERPAEAPA